ncbi:MAG: GNAT family N-acetyltransferase; N-acetyltransferase [Novosphingobium sp.]
MRRAADRLIGWCGAICGSAGPIAGKAERGWRMAADCWGSGYAAEAARIGMTWLEGGAFDHPKVPQGDPLQSHVPYRITRAHWQRQ